MLQLHLAKSLAIGLAFTFAAGAAQAQAPARDPSTLIAVLAGMGAGARWRAVKAARSASMW
ncbi:MAG: hypothetical protein U1E24_12750 [Phenylobacterium sp.]|nr:hypothetical protein [Phenylobacterium sp.]